jgi:hypothetical protein
MLDQEGLELLEKAKRFRPEDTIKLANVFKHFWAKAQNKELDPVAREEAKAQAMHVANHGMLLKPSADFPSFPVAKEKRVPKVKQPATAQPAQPVKAKPAAAVSSPTVVPAPPVSSQQSEPQYHPDFAIHNVTEQHWNDLPPEHRQHVANWHADYKAGKMPGYTPPGLVKKSLDNLTTLMCSIKEHVSASE